MNKKVLRFRSVREVMKHYNMASCGNCGVLPDLCPHHDACGVHFCQSWRPKGRHGCLKEGRRW